MAWLLKEGIFKKPHGLSRRLLLEKRNKGGHSMAFQKVKMQDCLRGRKEEILIRFDPGPKNLAKLPCTYEYDPVMCKNADRYVLLVKKIEQQNARGVWVPYPSAACLSNTSGQAQLVSTAFIKKAGEEGFDIVFSDNMAPDIKLLKAVKNAGIHFEFIEG